MSALRGWLVWNARGLETMKWKGGSDVARLIDWQQENNLEESGVDDQRMIITGSRERVALTSS